MASTATQPPVAGSERVGGAGIEIRGLAKRFEHARRTRREIRAILMEPDARDRLVTDEGGELDLAVIGCTTRCLYERAHDGGVADQVLDHRPVQYCDECRIGSDQHERGSEIVLRRRQAQPRPRLARQTGEQRRDGQLERRFRVVRLLQRSRHLGQGRREVRWRGDAVSAKRGDTLGARTQQRKRLHRKQQCLLGLYLIHRRFPQ
jgi:hypothetical protein